jgi:hypothetical protein
MSRIPNLASERGAVLIQTAVASLVLVGFGTFVVDYGVLWVGRHQAQNAADAGATAGAIARAYDDFDDPPPADGVAANAASQVASKNLVWGASSPTTAAVTSFACPPEVGDPRRCVRVDVYRNGDNGSSPLPMWFAPLLGIAKQGVKATASAQVLIPKATNCLRPWAIPDKWIESSAVLPSTFTKYQNDGTELSPPHDEYAPPTLRGPGTGFKYATSNAAPEDFGSLVPLTLYTNIANPISPGWLVPLDLTGGYAASLAACNGQPIKMGDQITVSATLPNGADLEKLRADDPGAFWNAVSRTIDNSCAPAVCAKLSPRLVAIAVFDVDIFQYRQATGNWSACPPGSVGCLPCPGGAFAPCVSVVNIVGFFVTNSAGPNGYLTSYPGVIPTDPPVLSAQSSFLKATTLVR